MKIITTKLAITGANGFVGKHLQNTFNHVVVLQRDDSVDVLIDKLKGDHT